jgi:hypothetical protein
VINSFLLEMKIVLLYVAKYIGEEGQLGSLSRNVMCSVVGLHASLEVLADAWGPAWMHFAHRLLESQAVAKT